jgi:DNA-binding transcriptional LysR family regulator
MRLDLFSLNLFADIVETRSIGGGAKRHHIAVSAASKRIADLEQRFGTPLLLRHARGVQATEAGEALHRRIRQTLDDLQQIAVEMSEFAQGGRGKVHLLANSTAIIHCLPHDLAAFTQAHPGIGVNLEERSTNDTLDAVAKGTADVGIVAPVTRYPAGLHYWPYQAVPCVLVVPHAHPLARRTVVSFQDTLAYEYIGLAAGGGWDRLMSAAAAALGVPLRVRIRVDGFEAACRMVEAQLGISFVPERTAQLHARSLELKIVPIEDRWATVHLSVCSRDIKTLAVAGRLLVRHLAEHARAAPAGEPGAAEPEDAVLQEPQEE